MCRKTCKVDLTTLETRRLREDLTEVFKIFRVFNDVGSDVFYKISVIFKITFFEVNKRLAM